MMVMGTTNSLPFEPMAPWLDVFLLMAWVFQMAWVFHVASSSTRVKGLSTSMPFPCDH